MKSGFFKFNIAAIVWAVIIMILCGIPGNDFPDVSFLDWLRPDKIVHLVMFGVLNFLLIRGFMKQGAFQVLQRLPYFYATIISILYGVLIEILQATVFIGRSGDWRDAAADALGAFCGIAVFNFRMRRTNS